MFLPQFHEIPENSKWWGERFTEWVKVKSAKSFFKGHQQPLVPLNNNYYNLLEKETMIWQTELMNEYKIDGFVYYHYYFKGKLLLEKPAENLLDWKDIAQSFFFCWANHSWTKAWEFNKEILMEQTYGNENDWENHFQYLLPFFKDCRYEKRNNKPVFMVYNANFREYIPMMEYFNNRCIQSGFEGIYLISKQSIDGKGCLLDIRVNDVETHRHFREPDFSLNIISNDTKWSLIRVPRILRRLMVKCGCESFIEKYDGNKLYNYMVSRQYDERDIPGAFFAWDNTPRYGKDGFVIFPPDKEVFFQYMNKIEKCEFVLINAWNEWSEGMVLEPTEQERFKYLEWIKEWNSRDK